MQQGDVGGRGISGVICWQRGVDEEAHLTNHSRRDNNVVDKSACARGADRRGGARRVSRRVFLTVRCSLDVASAEADPTSFVDQAGAKLKPSGRGRPPSV